MQIMGHRGAAGLAPENTLIAFKKAAQLKVDWIEFDVHRTRDGHIVVVHDKTTKRIANRNLTIKNSTLKQLQNLKTYSEQQIPTLDQAIKAIGKKSKINIELKSAGCEVGIIKAIKKSGLPKSHFIISSFKGRYLKSIKRLDPKLDVALLHFFPFKFLFSSLPLKAVGFNHYWIPEFLIFVAKNRGLFTYSYTVNDAASAKKLQQKGIDAIVSDYPSSIILTGKADNLAKKLG